MSNTHNIPDGPAQAFKDAMAEMGVVFEGAPIMDGKLHRVDIVGRRRGAKHGWYVGYTNGVAAGAFGDYKAGLSETWCQKRPERMSDDERRALRERMEAARKEREAALARVQAEAREAAAAIWQKAAKASADHPYLARKGIPPLPGLKQLGADVRYVIDGERKTARAGALVVPLFRPDGTLASVQLIDAEGVKRFLKGTEKAGSYTSIGKPTSGDKPVIFIGEGYSTAAQVHRATGALVVVAFDRGNLEPVAKAIRAKYPTARIIFAADNDRHTRLPNGTPVNPGLDDAVAAARAVKGRVAVPLFPEGDLTSTDFDDLARLEGLDSVKAALRKSVRPGDVDALLEEHARAQAPQAHDEAPPHEDVPEGEPAPDPPMAWTRGPARAAEVRNLGVGGLELQSTSPTHLGRSIRLKLDRHFRGQIAYDDGCVYAWDGDHWEALDDEADLGALVADLDGMPAGKSTVAMNPKKRREVIEELKLDLRRHQPRPANFFAGAAPGINTVSGFARIGDGGRVEMEPHRPDQRQRWLFDAEYHGDVLETPPPGTLFASFVERCFAPEIDDKMSEKDKKTLRDDSNAKVALLGEVFGAAAAGLGTRIRAPKAILALGGANCGKSTMLHLLRALVPQGAQCSIPFNKFRDEKHLVRLAGKLLNAVDELSAERIASDEFKRVITGEPISPRDVFKSVIEFRPVALHVVSANDLPYFAGGLDSGLRRRLLPLAFTRSIPVEEQIPDLAQRIIADEGGYLIGFALAGARRLLQNGTYTLPASSEHVMRELESRDPVAEWAAEHIEVDMRLTRPADGWPTQADAYSEFKQWAVSQGYLENKMVQPDEFWRRIKQCPGLIFRRIDGRNRLYLSKIKKQVGIDKDQSLD